MIIFGETKVKSDFTNNLILWVLLGTIRKIAI